MRFKIYCRPIFFCAGILVCFFGNFCNADNFRTLITVIEKNKISFFHCP